MHKLQLTITEHVKIRDYGAAYRRACMAETLREGLAMANRGNPYWTKRDAMQAFAIFHNSQRSE